MKPLVAAILSLGLASAALAQDQQLGARTKAMGGSYTAFEDDPVSVWLNPAGIATQPDQFSFAYQTYTAYPVEQDEGPASSTVYSVKPEMIVADPAIIPSYIGFVFQLGSPEDAWAIGVCHARPYHLNYAMDRVTSESQTQFEPQNEMEQSLARFRATLAKDFRLRKAGEAGFLTHVSVGAGLDLGYEHWEFRQPTGDTSDTAAGLGFGAGLLVGVYDDTESFRVNLGFAWQSKIEYNFSIDPTILPAFNMPEQFNIGATFYLLEGMPLRATVDLQFIGWKDTAEDPIFTGQPSFEDAVNVSFGLEYRIKINDRVSLYPRGGYRRFDAPWDDKDDLPSTGRYKLVLDTKDDVFNIFTYGAGVTWTSDAGKSRSVDLAGDAGGDAINVALGFTYEF